MDKQERIQAIIEKLRAHTQQFVPPLIDQLIAIYGKDPYIILIACLLSLRAKDATTIHVCKELFGTVRTPQALCALPLGDLERIIFKTGFYKQKAETLRFVSQYLLQHHQGAVPDTYQQLIAIKGVGPKTANLVLGQAFGKPAICVDTHVHRISNRLGLIQTTTVEETEAALKQLLPQRLWTEWNTQLVMWGQNVCAPLSPKCSSCPLASWCAKKGVTKHR